MENKQELYHTQNVMVANALITYGFRFVTFTHVVRHDGKQSKEFWFETKSPDCEFSAELAGHYLTKGHEDLAKIDKNHPLLWLRAFAQNRGDLISIIKNAPRMIEIRNGDRSALISENASPETRRKIAALL
jgi:hypothetical protein